MIIRRMCEGAVKCALRDFRREELTLRWAGGGVVRGSVGTESSGQASGATGYYQLTELSCCSVPRHPDSRKKGPGRAAPGGVLHGRDCPFGDCLRSLERDRGYCIGRSKNLEVSRYSAHSLKGLAHLASSHDTWAWARGRPPEATVLRVALCRKTRESKPLQFFVPHKLAYRGSSSSHQTCAPTARLLLAWLILGPGVMRASRELEEGQPDACRCAPCSCNRASSAPTPLLVVAIVALNYIPNAARPVDEKCWSLVRVGRWRGGAPGHVPLRLPHDSPSATASR